MTFTHLKFGLIFAVLIGLVCSIWFGLIRMGWQLQPPGMSMPISQHGGLLIGGVFGTLISLERAVAIAAQRPRAAGLAYLPSLWCALGGIGLLLNWNWVGQAFITLGSAGFVLWSGWMLTQHPALHSGILLLGALGWCGGNLLWLSGSPIFQVVYWWAAFLIFTIAGERLELARILRLTSYQRRLFAGAVGILTLGVMLTVVSLDFGARITGLGMIALAAWLGRYDIARYTLRRTGLPRFIAACLLSGYGWLGVGGVLLSWNGAVYAGLLYDAVIHSLFLGFVMAMIFGHAPIILPALTGRAIRYHPFLYVLLAGLHASLALRVISDLAGSQTGRMWGGMANMLVLAVFGVTMALNLRIAPSADASEITRFSNNA